MESSLTGQPPAGCSSLAWTGSSS